MPLDIHYILLFGSLLVCLSLVSGILFARFGFSTLLVTLGVGVAIGNGGMYDINYNYPEFTLHLSEVALCVIIFFGGFESKWGNMRPYLGKAVLLSTLGVLITTGVLGWGIHELLDWPIEAAMLMGAVVSGTDAAAVFSVIERSGIRMRRGITETLELESGTNDPMAWFLTLAITETMVNGEVQVSKLFLELALSAVVGATSGYLASMGVLQLINRLPFKRGQTPVLILAMVLFLYGLNVELSGSAFLAVYVAGIKLGNVPWPNRQINVNFFEGNAWLMETLLFLVIGMQIYPDQLADGFLPGLLVAAILMLFARPLGVLTCTAFIKQPVSEKLFIAWMGLRGATPIVFSLIPVVMDVPYASQIFSISFVVVIASILVQGGSVGWAAGLFRVRQPESVAGRKAKDEG